MCSSINCFESSWMVMLSSKHYLSVYMGWLQQCTSMCQRWLIIANRTMEGKKDWWMWVGEQVKCAIFQLGDDLRAPQYEEIVTQHYTCLHPTQRSSLMNVKKKMVKKGLVCLYFPSQCADTRICQDAGMLCGGPECPGSSFILYTGKQKRTKINSRRRL